MTKKRKLYNSSAAFAIGHAVYTDSSSGCLRAIMLSAEGVRTDIAPEYSLVGATHEHQYMRQLQAGGRLRDREKPLQRELSASVTQSGRMDFVLTDDQIHECKATFSENVYRQTIKKGEPKANHVAQLVSYLVNTGTTRGELVYGFYEETPLGQIVLKEQRGIRVEIDAQGGILIDGAPYEYTVADQLAHTALATAALEASPAVPARPANAEQQWGSPCGLCVFKSTCDRYDAGEPIDFVESARLVAEQARPTPATIKRRKS